MAAAVVHTATAGSGSGVAEGAVPGSGGSTAAERSHGVIARALGVVLSWARRMLPPLVVFVVLVGLWQACVSLGLLPANVVSEPEAVARLLGDTLGGTPLFGASIWVDIRSTMEAILMGYAIGAVVGILGGYSLGRSEVVAGIFRPYIRALAAVPKIALVPLLLLLFGIGVTAEMVNAAIMVFIIVIFSTFSGVVEVEETYVDLARIMGAKRFAIARSIVVPSALPSVFSGLRSGVSFAFIGAITDEFIAAQRGLGWMMERATSGYDPTALFVGLVYVIVLVWLMAEVVRLFERRVLRWMYARKGN